MECTEEISTFFSVATSLGTCISECQQIFAFILLLPVLLFLVHMKKNLLLSSVTLDNVSEPIMLRKRSEGVLLYSHLLIPCFQNYLVIISKTMENKNIISYF